ncbi:MAG: hypothetical protein D6748_13170, partial [Calditrichaeota bacterium]
QKVFEYMALSGKKQQITLQPGELAFTLCQVPVIYRRGEKPGITVTLSDGTEEKISGLLLSDQLSQLLFRRDGVIEKIAVTF